MVLRHRYAAVREHASLQAQGNKDARDLRSRVSAIAHPGKLRQQEPSPLRDTLSRLYGQVSMGAWAEAAETGRNLLAGLETQADCRGDSRPDSRSDLRSQTRCDLRSDPQSNAELEHSLRRLLEDPALARLQRLSALAQDNEVQQYLALWAAHGPRSGSAEAAAQGAGAQQRGAHVEAKVAQALDALAAQLNRDGSQPCIYRVVTAMQVPAVLVDSAERAKTEWDVVVLRHPKTEVSKDTGDAVGTVSPPWDICLLVEVKASPDAATTDYPRLLRGLQLLTKADPHSAYPFRKTQGTVLIRGASLHALPTTDVLATFHEAVLYASDTPADSVPKPLGAASRMQLLSSTTTLDYASRLATSEAVDMHDLEPVWQALLTDPRWLTVLNQYATLRRVRELMVHVADLEALLEK
ncbi:3-deoxy-D-arabino-heptulosonate 7-phosphate synthase [Pigmentiphaga litoralis]|uniref:3-deoxy-D-arabino-heptulosonate 7-phosphate synthase n=1 Tax=Pigmentiphaga litoralis TaxID=516702 RepID=UPI003B43C0A4